MSDKAVRSPAPQAAEAAGTLLQRKCASGQAASALAEECESCLRADALGIQAKLAIGGSDDPLEREADRAAEQALGGPVGEPLRPGFEMPTLSRRGAGATRPAAAAPASVHRVLGQRGEPLPDAVRDFFEPRFGHDFSSVRIHRDGAANRSAAAVNAEAYTVGNRIVFGADRYRPDGNAGRRLLAHELAHVVQQSGPAQPVLRRAIFRQGELTVQVNYDDVVLVPAAERPDRIIAQVTDLTLLPPTAGEEARIRGLAEPDQEWLLFALQLLSDNRDAATNLDMGFAFDYLIAHAPNAQFRPLPDPDDQFVREVLRVSRWSETALAERLPAPDVYDEAVVDDIVNPPREGRQRLNLREFNRRLPPALEHFLIEIDPANWTSTGTRSITAFQTIASIVMDEARVFFAPYADAAAGNLFDLTTPWDPTTNVFDTNAERPNASDRESYLLNRAEVVGRSTETSAAVNDAGIFEDTRFDNQRDRDKRALLRVVHHVQSRPGMRTRVNRIIRHTGVQFGSGTATQIGISTRFDAGSLTACEDHWAGIGTMCHEVLHALVHPEFRAVSERVSFPQVIIEGATEALSVQLFNDHFLVKQREDPDFKARLESGVSGAPCPAPALRPLRYGTAGQGAEEIRAQVGDDNFRAAYFLGQVQMAGLPT